MVRAVELADSATFRVSCKFLPGSSARGCMVVLVSEAENTTVNLTRTNYEKDVMVTYSPSCYNKIIAYDIEQDGTVGTLAFPGDLAKVKTLDTAIQCSLKDTAGMPRRLSPICSVYFIMVCVMCSSQCNCCI